MIIYMKIKDVLNEDYELLSYNVAFTDLKREYPKEYHALTEMSSKEAELEFFRLACRWLEWHDVTVESISEAKLEYACYN